MPPFFTDDLLFGQRTRAVPVGSEYVHLWFHLSLEPPLGSCLQG